MLSVCLGTCLGHLGKWENSDKGQKDENLHKGLLCFH